MSGSNYQIMYRCLNCFHVNEQKGYCRECGFLLISEAGPFEIEDARIKFMRRNDADE